MFQRYHLMLLMVMQLMIMMAGIANDAAGGKFQGELGDDVVDEGC